MNHDPLQSVLDRLDGVRQRGENYMARCPAHEDRHASLSVRSGEGGKAVLHCHAGCEFAAIVAALGMDPQELFPDPDKNGKPEPPKIVATYDYVDEQGALLYQVVRFEPKTFRQRRPDPSRPTGWDWSVKGVRQVPYHLPEVKATVAAGRTVFVTEGEKDVLALSQWNFCGTTNAGGAGKWRSEYAAHFHGVRVVLIPDNDAPGREHADQVGASLKGIAKSVQLLSLPGVPAKGDLSDWIDRGGTREAFVELVKAAPLWSPAATPEPGEAPPAAPEAPASNLPPQNLEMEAAILGAALVSDEARQYLCDELYRECFFLEKNRIICQAIFNLAEAEAGADPLSVTDELSRMGLLEKAGGPAYVFGLPGCCPAPTNFVHYGEQVLDPSLRRLLIEQAKTILTEAGDRSVPCAEVISRAETRILGADHRRKSQSAAVGPDVLARTMLGNVMGGEDQVPMLPTGWARFDRITRGLPQGLLTLIAGRPGMGKTTLALAWLLRMVKSGIPSLMFSTETPRSQVMRRVTSVLSGIPSDRLWPTEEDAPEKREPITPDEMKQIAESAQLLREWPFHLDDESELTVGQIRSRIRREKKAHGIKVVFIDQLQTIVRSNRENDNSSLTNEVIYPLQRMARAENVAVVLLCQLSRQNERREKNSRRPILSDMRDTGSLEQAARLVVMLHRPGYYEGQPGMIEDDLEVLIRKHNEGATGGLAYRWNLPTYRLSEVDNIHDDADAPPVSTGYGYGS